MVELDPRWEWIEVQTFGDQNPMHIRARCKHLETVPVDTVAGEHVAQLCLTCDAQLPPGHGGLGS